MNNSFKIEPLRLKRIKSMEKISTKRKSLKKEETAQIIKYAKQKVLNDKLIKN